MDEFSWGIIGTGTIAAEFAQDLPFASNARHRVSAVLSREMNTAREFADKYAATDCFDNLEQFTAHAGVDAVYIATPHPMHYEETLACLHHGLPVLCEKPMGLNRQQVANMIAASEETGTFLMEGIWTRFLPSIEQVLSMLENQAIGDIRQINADLSFRAPREKDSRYFDPVLGGGSLLDLGIYPVFIAQLLMGRPDHIHSFMKKSKAGIDENCAMLLQFGNDRYALLESSLITETPLTATITGTTGKIILTPTWCEKPPSVIFEKYDGLKCEEPLHWEGRGLQFEAEEVFNCINQGKIASDKMPHSFSLELIETLDTIRHQHSVRYPSE